MVRLLWNILGVRFFETQGKLSINGISASILFPTTKNHVHRNEQVFYSIFFIEQASNPDVSISIHLGNVGLLD